jgi:hypothetical protein
MANKNAFIAALNTFAAASNEIVRTLRQAAVDAGFNTWESAEPVVFEWASTRYNVGLVESKSPRNKGAMVLDRSAANYEAAKTAIRRVREAMIGDVTKPSAKAEETEIPEELIAAAAKLAKLAQQYEGARSLASKALALAFAK